jgi:GT2 family glycosyltransferase
MTYEVAMATCNGERFLDQQIASILGQTLPPQRLLVADDHSSDATLQLLQYWQRSSSIPIELVPPVGSARLGCCRNFERLIQASAAPYLMLADQDDVWDQDKATKLLRQMDLLEKRFGSDSPLLVHADLRLIDAEGRLLASSFHRHQGLAPDREGVLEIAMQNVVTGCASLVNRACVRKALPFPVEVVLHDWWLALVAAQAGAVVYLPEPCVSYRQHRTNVVGAAGWRRQLLRRIRQVLAPNWQDVAADMISPSLLQLRACIVRLDPVSELRARLELLWSHSCWVRLRTALGLGLRKHGLWRTVGFYVALVCCRPADHCGRDASSGVNLHA